MDCIAEILKQVKGIMALTPWIVDELAWLTDDFEGSKCFFCGTKYPNHYCCPYAALEALEQQLLREAAALIEAGEVE